MKSLILSVVAILAMVLFTMPTHAEGYYYGGWYGPHARHSAHHDDLEHRAYHRELEHRSAHRYPMSYWQHEALHDDLDHEAFHDHLEHRGAHASGAYYSRPYGYGRYSYPTPYYRRGFSLYIGR